VENIPNIYLAPFQGITGVTFRRLYTKHFKGVDKLFTPFFTGIQNDSRLTPRRLAELGNIFENNVEVIPQILSKDAGEIIRFASLCSKLGFREINWNLGCPYPQVATKKRGSGMLPYPAMVEEILQKVMQEITIRFSVKCRLGYNSIDEINALIPLFNRYAISEVTIHARIGKQLYSGIPDQDAFEKSIELLSVPLVYNGDIFSYSDYLQLNARFETIHTWMIGRGLLSDPFLPSIIKGIPIPNNRKETIRRFIEDLYLGYRKQTNDSLASLGVLKEYWNYLAESFDDPHKVFKKVKKVTGFDEYEDAVAFVFQEYGWIGSDKKNSVQK